MDECKPLHGGVKRCQEKGCQKMERGGGFCSLHMVGRCRLTLSNPRFKRPELSALKLEYDKVLSLLLQFCFQFQLAPLQHGGRQRH